MSVGVGVGVGVGVVAAVTTNWAETPSITQAYQNVPMRAVLELEFGSIDRVIEVGAGGCRADDRAWGDGHERASPQRF
jgi:hypothetical protein